MQNFKVTVNGRVYEVTVEEGSGATAPAAVAPAAPAAPVADAAPAAAPAAPKPVGTVEAGDVVVNAPLAGVILYVKVKPGESVKYGQVLLTLEALKMENEIVAPQDGVVKEILVDTGTNVNVGDALVTLKA
ncbi:MAG TPA: biotin/lipoyl-binding protein [Bacillota bacterium]|nr:biotin/lipoyl-binding protein [Bacillota bacterium]